MEARFIREVGQVILNLYDRPDRHATLRHWLSKKRLHSAKLAG
jgi:hypothetical protein